MPSVTTLVKEVPHLLVTESQMPTEPSLRAIADDVLALSRCALVAAATGDGATRHSGLDQTCQSFIASRGATARARYLARSKALLDAPPELRVSQFGRYATLSNEEIRGLGADGAVQKQGHLQLPPATMRSSLDALRARVLHVATAAPLEVSGNQTFFHLDPKSMQAVIGAASKTTTPKPTPHLSGLAPLIKDMQNGLAFKKMRERFATPRAACSASRWHLEADTPPAALICVTRCLRAPSSATFRTLFSRCLRRRRGGPFGRAPPEARALFPGLGRRAAVLR